MRSFLNETAEKDVPCCTLVILGMQTIGFLYENEELGFIFFKTCCECLYFILIKLKAINIVDYLINEMF